MPLTSELLQEMIFDSLEPVEIPVTIKGDKYVLREASGDAAAKWRNAVIRAAKLHEGKVTMLDGVGDTEPLLVSLCLYRTDKRTGQLPLRPDGNPDNRWLVSLQTIRSWPARIQMEMFKRIRAISQLEEKDEDTVESITKKIRELVTKRKEMMKIQTNGSHAQGQDGSAEEDDELKRILSGDDGPNLPGGPPPDPIHRTTQTIDGPPDITNDEEGDDPKN